MVRNNLFLLSVFFIPFISTAQFEMVPLNSLKNYQDLKNYKNDTVTNSGIYRSLIILSEDTKLDIKNYNNRFLKYIRNEHVAKIKDSTLTLYADPFLNISETGHGDTMFSSNSRGLIFRGKLSENFYFMSAAVENQVYYPDYQRNYFRERYVVSGTGRYKGFKETGFDYAYAFGQILWKPVKLLSIEAGHGKQFIGEGYRSLILSDFSSFYPFLKFSFDFKRFQFVQMFTAFQDVKTNDSRLLVYQRSHGSFTSVGYKYSEKFKISLTESIIWQTYGEGYNNKFPATFFIPVPLYRTFLYGLSNENNISLGLNAAWRPIYSILFYTQFLLDDVGSFHNDSIVNMYNKYGWQTGIRVIEPFRLENLFILAEYNRVMPFTYSSEYRRQSYSGMNEPLAHPLGANFSETVVQIHYRYHSLILSASYSGAITGKDISGNNFGSDIFKSDTTASVNSPYYIQDPPGIKTEITNSTVEAGFIINPRYNLIISAGIKIRNFKNELKEQRSELIFIKLSTYFLNTYNDY